MKKFYFSIIAFCFAIILSAQTATFNITYVGFTTQAQTAYQFSADIWSNTVVSTVPIKVTAHFTALIPGTLGITFPNGRKNFPGAPIADKWYATSLANSLTGTELNPGEADVEMYINSNINWYYGTSGSVPAGQYDLATIVLHELCHGLGFLSLAKDSSGIGSFGLIRNADFYNLVTAFPWPNLDTLPSIFDNFLVSNTNQLLDSFPNPSSLLAGKFTNNNVFFAGTNAITANGGIKPRIYAPGTFTLGSSITHLNESTYPAGNPNELMTPNGNLAYSLHNPGPICIGILKDIGWTINPSLSIDKINYDGNKFSIYPNPSANLIYINTTIPKEKIKKVIVINIFGETLLNIDNSLIADVSTFPKGIYFISISSTEFQVMQKFIKE